MTNTEYRKYRQHILGYMDGDLKRLKNELENYKSLPESKGTLRGAVDTMCQDDLFDISYDQVLETLKDIYGIAFDESKYITKDRRLRWKNGEVYCWKVYKAKLARTIEIMEKRGNDYE